MGDIPNLVVDEKGVGAMAATTSRITLSPGPLSVFDAYGSVIIVHGKLNHGSLARRSQESPEDLALPVASSSSSPMSSDGRPEPLWSNQQVRVA
jgi:hypothetical protein